MSTTSFDAVPQAKTRGASAVNLPNIITLGRIFLAPFVVWLIIADEMTVAFVMFLLAGFSDGLDGYLAKRFGWRTELGAYLDPMADKALLMSIYVALGLFAHLPVWLVIAVVSRDILIIGAVLLSWMLGRPVRVKPLLVSKANTAGQIVLAGLVLGELALGLGLGPVIKVLIWIVGALTILSAAAYLRQWVKHMAIDEELSAPLADQPRRPVSGR